MPTALVIGAGIGGLSAGIALRRAGWDVRVFERASARHDAGFALGLARNAMVALRELGVGDLVAARGVMPTSGEIRHPGGRVLRRLAGGPHESARDDLPRLILRPALGGALVGALAARGATVELNRQAVRFDDDGAGVTLVFADGSTARGDVLVGADGVASIVRAALHPDEPPARPSGYVAIRGLSRAVARMNGLGAIWYLGRGVEAAMIQAGPDAVYWFMSLLAEDVGEAPFDVARAFRAAAAGFDRQFHDVAGAAAPEDMRLDELFVRDPIDDWARGRATLLGDAAHPMLPHTGQGAAQAIEDAVGLGRALRDGAADPIAALRRYERVRARRTARVVRLGPRLARMTTTKSAVARAVRDAAIRLAPGRAIVRAFTRREPDPNCELGETLASL